MRAANAIDFWRGVALVMIFINHVPGNFFANYTLQRFALSDAAELFVFLAGWSLSLATGGPLNPDPTGKVVARLAFRTIQIYRAQIVVTAIALASLAAMALLMRNPLFLEWHNAGPIFFDPAQTIIGWVLLIHHIGYFDILPLYVVLIAMAPLFIVLARRSLAAGLGLSFAVYAAALTWQANLPTWPVDQGGWLFNPLAWQFLMVLGFVSAELARSSDRFRTAARRAVPVGLALFAVSILLTRFRLWPDPAKVPEPQMFFIFNKTFLTPGRLVSCLGIVLAFQGAFAWIGPRLPRISGFLSALGRNSLPVFCIGSLASLWGQIFRFVHGGSFTADLATVVCGLGFMYFTAWFVEWRSRYQGHSQPASS